MNKTLFAILALFLAVSARHLSHYAEDPYYSHEYPSHAYYADEFPSHAYYDMKYPSHYDDEEYSHEKEGDGMKLLFDALKNDPTASQLLKSPPKDQSSYKQLQSSILNVIKGNEQVRNQLADDMFGNGKIGALFNTQQRVKILNYVTEHPDVVKGNKAAAKNKVIEFIKSDPELSAIYNQNSGTFSHY